MKILITGGAGFIGNALIKKLVNEHDVVSLDNYSIGLKANHVEGAQYIDGDVNEILDIIENDFDICFHLAALSRIQPSFEKPFNTFKNNTEGVQKVLDWCRINNTKCIYSGSSSRHHNPHISPYALYKYLGEEICKMYKEVYKLNVEIVRFYNVYGPGEILDGDWAAVIGLWRRQIRDNQPITIVGDGKQRRDFTHIDDIVDGLVKIAYTKTQHSDAWELGTGSNYSIIEVAEMFKNRFGCDFKFLPKQKGNYRETLRENDDALTQIDWNPKKELKKYIESL